MTISREGRDPAPEELEQEIERTRERMTDNISAIERRLSPGQLKRQAKAAMAEKAQDVVASLQNRARLAGTRVADVVRRYPRHMAVAAGAIVLLWLARGRRRRPAVRLRKATRRA